MSDADLPSFDLGCNSHPRSNQDAVYRQKMSLGSHYSTVNKAHLHSSNRYGSSGSLTVVASRIVLTARRSLNSSPDFPYRMTKNPMKIRRYSLQVLYFLILALVELPLKLYCLLRIALIFLARSNDNLYMRFRTVPWNLKDICQAFSMYERGQSSMLTENMNDKL